MGRTKNIQPGDIIETPATVAPKSVTPTQNITIHEKEVDVPDGHVLIVALDANGQEKPDSSFFYPEKSYQRFFSDTSKFAVKKKGNPLKS